MSIGPSKPKDTLAQAGYSGPSATPTISPSGQNIPTTINTAGAQPFVGAQTTLEGQLAAQANGTGGPTLAQQQLTSGVNANLASALAAGASSTRMGQNPGQAAKSLEQAQANINSQAAGQAAQTRGTEQLAAQSQLGQLSTAAAGQQLQQAQAQQAATAQGQEFGATQAQQAQEYGAGLSAAAQSQYNQAISGLTNTVQAGELVPYESAVNPSTYLGPASGLGSAGLGAAAMSDEAVKQGISSETATAQSFLDALGKYVSGGTGGIAPPSPAAQNITTNISNANPNANSGPTGAQEATYASQIGAVPVNTPTGASGNDNLNLMPAGTVTSDEDSKKHIDQLTDALQSAIENKANAATVPVTVATPYETRPIPQLNPVPPQTNGGNALDLNANVFPSAAPQAQSGLLQGAGIAFNPTNTITNFPGGIPVQKVVENNIEPDQNYNPATGTVTSDENEKELVDSNKMKMHSYEYKDPDQPGAAHGVHFGPMAQEIEKAGPIGKSVVFQGPDGIKRVDTGRLALALAGAAGVLNNKIQRLEEALKGSIKSDEEK